ncbi:hypothetical protein [Acinetobacter sp. YH12227]|uniref:hypothetical protein n=1 Tax=Acinetobacter sp. YH12227 TaxID=2601158 RepID=UPI001C555C7D|nr:hypothetical protein [Acinetobacter sp. YH12227]
MAQLGALCISNLCATKPFFKELNLGNDDDFVIVDPKKIAGKFGAANFIHLINVPNFDDKDRFLKWAYTQLNR